MVLSILSGFNSQYAKYKKIMNKLQYRFHILLNSRYKFLITLSIYLIFIYLSNTDIQNVTYCEEKHLEENTLTTKLIGTGLFIGSITLMILLQQLNSTIDPSVAADAAMQAFNSNSVIELPACLDDFSISGNGDIYQKDLQIDPDNTYLNAMVVQEELKSIVQAQQDIINDLEVINAKHQLLAHQNAQLLLTFEKLEIINPMYYDVYNNFLEEGNRPEDFCKFVAEGFRVKMS